MATANRTFTRPESLQIIVGRSQVSTPLGDLWPLLPLTVTDTERFAMGTTYNTLEAEIDDVVDSGFLAFLTYGDNTIHGIGRAPSRPIAPTH